MNVERGGSMAQAEQPTIKIEIYTPPAKAEAPPNSDNPEFDYDSLRGGIYDVYPDHKPFFYDLGQRLRGVLNGEVSVEDYNDYLDNLEPEKADLVFNVNSDLGDAPLIHMRKTIDAEMNFPKK